MKLPFCPRCGAKSRLIPKRNPDHVSFRYDLKCTKCPHAVLGHYKPEAAVKAFLWQHTNQREIALTEHTLACGCPLSGCTHRMFESAVKEAS